MKKLIIFSTILFVSLTGVLSSNLAYSQDGIEEIVVTARKRAENLSEIPLAITVFSARDIQESGFKNLEDLSLQVAGFQHSAQGGQAPGRVNSQLRFRGMNVNSLSEDPSLNIATMFVDGIYVIGGYHSIPLEEVERVEVIKGPQSALYGRSTFGGAVNYITKDPSTEGNQGHLDVLVGEDGERIVYGSFEGPITDVLSARIAAKQYKRDGIFTASDGGSMGAEETESIVGSLVAKGDTWKIKIRAFHSEDMDGAPAGGYVLGYRNDTCTGTSATTNDPSAPNVSPKNYVCGMVPGPGSAIDYFGGTNVVNMNAIMTANAAAKMDALPITSSFANGNVPSLPYGQYGMARDADRLNINTTFDLSNDSTLEASWGFNKVAAMWVRDFDYTGFSNSTARDPYISRDRTFDVKLISSQDNDLRWLVGINRYEQDFIHRGQGGAILLECVNSFGMPNKGFYNRNPDGSPNLNSPAALWFLGVPAPIAPFDFESRTCNIEYKGGNAVDTGAGNNSDSVISQGIYASVDYDFSEQLTLSTEARWQREKISQVFAQSTTNELTFDNLLPRVILRYKANENSMFYASYSKGVLPGKANDAVQAADDRELAQYRETQPNVLRFLDEEELDSYELGWKGSGLLDGRATLSVALYQADWANQKGRSTAVINETCRAPDLADANIDCSVVGEPKKQLNGTPQYNVRNFAVMGNSEINGIEIEGTMQVTEKFSVVGTLGIADSEFNDYSYNFVSAFAGYSQMAGNTMPRYPEDSASLSGTYKDTLNNGWDMFVRGDINYFGETYADESNLATCDSYTLANARGGVEKDNIRLELYVNNLFNEEAWTACARWSDFASPSSFALFTASQGISVTPLRSRNLGLRISYDF